MKNIIAQELRRHAPFTVFGAVTGIAIMLLFRGLPYNIEYNIFYIIHPLHVLLSALVTSAIYKRYKCGGDNRTCRLLPLLAVGFAGSIGIATLSDSIVPYLGELLLKMPHAEPHIGFIEEWYIIFPLAGVGIGIAYFCPETKFPHAGHVLISTWASLFHMMMAKGSELSLLLGAAIFLFLFFSVWIPCCISDIVFPLLFVGNSRVSPTCGAHETPESREKHHI